MNFRYCLVLILLSSPALNAADGKKITVLDPANLTHWEEKSFAGNTRYTARLNQSPLSVHAQTQASASGLYREIRIDLNQTPFLNWSWKIENTLGQIDETSKSGDDYPARIYIVVSGGIRFWKTRALNYVWSSNQPQNSHWPNAFTENAHMLAIDSGNSKAGQWLSHRRNVKRDLQKYLGLDVSHIDAIAIMSDSDNSGLNSSAEYGPIVFSD